VAGCRETILCPKIRWRFHNLPAIIFAHKFYRKLKRVVGLIVVLMVFQNAFSQDTLPGFSVVERGNKVIVSWINPFETCIQLNVQRSYDSIKYFRTVYSATSPGLPQNGFSEARQPTNRTYYRIFYVLEGGAYFFTASKLAATDADARDIKVSPTTLSVLKTITINSRGTLVALLQGNQFTRFRDSILRQTKDTIFAINDSLIELRQFVAKEIWRASNYIFTTKEGYLTIALSEADKKKYHIKFFEDGGPMLFEINHIKEPLLTLDKANFVHSGWFTFELYEDDKLKEKNKFYLPKDF
jgi:hypothetical protein